MGAPTHESSLEWFEQLCRQQGLALTVQRRTILSVLLDSDDHPTADQVYEIVRQRLPGLSRTTVYRVLDTFV
ncbi:MAG TPA: transcriptional repressor, partial [Phycisphaerae bacterium]|nr:transcriptional repressor [Phycisphaerae bacterium]